MLCKNTSMFKSGFFNCFAGAVLFFLGNVSSAGAFDFSGWEVLLKEGVAPASIDGVDLNAVDYRKMKADSAFNKLVDALKTASLEDLKTREDRLAFWINVYNILAVKVVVDHYPVESIKDVGNILKSVWNRPAGVVAGKERTLNDVEHEILRKMGEPRIHLAIVCASVSCPDLRQEAYTPDRLDEQLDDQVKKFLANTGKGMKIDKNKRTLYLSSIFKWFEEDFASQGGVTAFVSRFVAPSDKKIIQGSGMKLKYLDYNWDLNEAEKK